MQRLSINKQYKIRNRLQQCVHYTFSNVGPDLDRNYLLYGGMVILGLRLFALCHKNVQNMEPVQNCMCSIVCAFSKQ